ncbi:shikimate dehydrogenase family protein [Scandinavium manionii]|uniref:shikimate dehydrogenase family protein n=1 Tax=Scandinavium manionii TaxID=2926520 RepID=UPI002166A1D8|nr:ThiF family adenylyltransferase [Scandinavium manionii]MCS2147449.1 ThiF family adenylyltransferase [Scandinavium manionii]MCS2167761.1 ThiF family adenylyltransferase [Scandinavium manionii]
MIITGNTRLIAHLGWPTESFKAPMIYNPWFAAQNVDVKVVPMGVRPEAFAAFVPALFQMTNLVGALVTMPHKVVTAGLMQQLSPTAAIAGACNAIRREEDGSLTGDMFDGNGFVQGIQRKGFCAENARALVVGCGGVGSAIAASLAAAGVPSLTLFDTREQTAQALAMRLLRHYPTLEIRLMQKDPQGHSLVVNATPMGMKPGDPLPLDVDRLTPGSYVGEVVMSQTWTPFLQAAMARDCQVQRGTDMLFEMIPAYLKFFGLPVATPEQLRERAEIRE